MYAIQEAQSSLSKHLPQKGRELGKIHSKGAFKSHGLGCRMPDNEWCWLLAGPGSREGSE